MTPLILAIAIGMLTAVLITTLVATTTLRVLKEMDDRINAIWDDYIDTEIDYMLNPELYPEDDDDSWDYYNQNPHND